MSEEDIRRYLGKSSAKSGLRGSAPPPPSMRPSPRPRTRPPSPPPQESFKDFAATHLLCPRCKQAMPVRERLLLFLPEGNLYDYACTRCGTSCGTRKAGH